MEQDEVDRLSSTWRAQRARLINVAFRILGELGAAEDAVQEAFARLLRADRDEIDDEVGWLVVVTRRICLDQIRSARARLDEPLAVDEQRRAGPGRDLDEPGDPADRVTLDDNVHSALQLVLRRLTPAERVVFVMHDVFQIPYDAIGETVGRPASSCRQLATRARLRIAGDSDVRRFGVEVPAERSVTDAFIAACAGGDIDQLLSILDPDVSGDGDFGPDAPRPPVATGAAMVAQRTLGFLGHGATIVSHPASTQPVLLVFLHGRLFALIDVTVVDGLITHLHASGAPEALDAVSDDLAELYATVGSAGGFDDR